MTRIKIIFLGIFSLGLFNQPIIGQNLSGIYTIGNAMGSEDYSTISAAITDLKSGTVTGDVEYQIGSGTYNETMDLSSVNSGGFTITFVGANKELTIIHPLDSIVADKSGISLENTSNVVLKNFTLEMDDISATKVDYDLNETKGINISNSTNINLENLILSNANYVFSEGFNEYIASAVGVVDVQNITISDSEISGAGNLVYLDDFQAVSITNNSFSDAQTHISHFRDSPNTAADGLQIVENSFTGPLPKDRQASIIYLYGYATDIINSSYSTNLLIDGNTIDTKVAGSDDTIHGIYLQGQDGAIIRNNVVEDGSYGIRLGSTLGSRVSSNEVYRASNRGFEAQLDDNLDVVNNIFTSGHQAVFFSLPSNVRLAHNTLYAYGTETALRIFRLGGDSLVIVNNIFSVENTASSEVVATDVSSTNVTIDYNLYSGRANTYTFVAFDIGSLQYNATTFTDWQTNQATYDQNSQGFAPVFAGTDDLHISNDTDYRFGTFKDDLTSDIDGDYRDQSAGIDVGADQYCNPACVAPSGAPAIVSFSPENGPVGSQITLFGTGFDEIASNNVVFFGATQATINSSSENELIVTVPYGATYEPISVFTNQLAAKSLTPFQVTFESNGNLDYDSFDGIVKFATDDDPRAVAIGDLDNDGLADMVSANFFGESMSVLRNLSSGQGNINFDANMDFTLPGKPREVLVEDFNGDGKLDIAVGYTNFAAFSIFRNITSTGSISFDTRQDIATTTDSYFIASSDIDADGQIDMIVTDYGSDNAIIFENTSNLGQEIGFTNHSSLVTGDGPSSIALGDIDQDGKSDIIVGNSTDGTISIFLKDDTAFGYVAKQDFAMGNSPLNITTGDLDGDGVVDIAAAINENVLTSFIDRIRILENNSTPGNLSFTASETITGIDWIDLEDMNGDGTLDPIYTEYFNGIGHMKNTSSMGNLSFGPEDGIDHELSGTFVTTGDMDNDGEPDIIHSGSIPGGNFIEIARNLSSGNSIISFSLAEQSSPAVIDAENHDVLITVTDCTDPSNLIPDFELSPLATVVAATVTQQSGVTANDFSSALIYEITAEDGSVQNWTVTVTATKFADNVVENITSCDSYEFDGATLTSSGQYQGTFTNIQGCDSLVTLNLTILQSDHVFENIQTCDPYFFDGENRITTGQYVGVFTNVLGCDSTVTLNLTVHDAVCWETGAWSNATGPTETENTVLLDHYSTGASGSLITKDLTISSGVLLEVQDESYFDVKGNIQNEGTIEVSSGGTFLTYDGFSFSGNDITVKRNTRYGDGKYSMVGIPVQQDGSITGSDLGQHVYKYDETQPYNIGSLGLEKWVTASSDVLSVGRGYTQANQQKIEFSGKPNAGTITYAGTYTVDDGSHEGFNLVSNPYTAAIDIAGFLAANTNIQGAIYIWDDNGSDTQRGTDADYVVANGIAATNSTPAGGHTRYNLAVGTAQAFFVKLNSDANTSVIFNESMRLTDKNGDDTFFRKEAGSLVRINLINTDGLFKQAVIAWKEDASFLDLVRAYDAPVFDPVDENLIYTIKSNTKLAIQAQPYEWTEIPLGLNLEHSGEYSIHMEGSELVYLYDLLKDELVDLSQEAYTFNISEVGTITDRFKLFSSPTIILNSDSFSTRFYASGKSIIVHDDHEIPRQISIVDMKGRVRIMQTIIGSKVIDAGQLASGIYVVTDGTTSTKVILK